MQWTVPLFDPDLGAEEEGAGQRDPLQVAYHG